MLDVASRSLVLPRYKTAKANDRKTPSLDNDGKLFGGISQQERERKRAIDQQAPHPSAVPSPYMTQQSVEIFSVSRAGGIRRDIILLTQERVDANLSTKPLTNDPFPLQHGTSK